MNACPRITFASGVSTVTGANFLFESSEGTHVLIDCGLIQGEKVAAEENRKEFSYDVNSIQALFVTHAHLDHVGRIPLLIQRGYRGPIYSTPETRVLAEHVLNDAVGILGIEAARDGLEPLYTANDVAKVFSSSWKTAPYHESFNLDDIRVEFKDAGHILGSAMIELRTQEKNILFTGDLGNSPSPLLRDTESPGEPDYIVMESVYGDRNHEPRELRLEQLTRIIRETVSRGGTLVIPAFSVDRTQVILFELNNLVEKGEIPSVPVFVDSPLATKVTDVYKSSSHLFNDQVQEQMKRDDIFSFKRLQFTISQNESRDIERMRGAKIILAGSGMSVGGRVIKHEEFYLPDERNTILLVGYQTAGSLGRQLVDGAKKVQIHKSKVKVKAHIEAIYGYSAHKDSDHLLEFVGKAGKSLKQVFTVMGEPGSAMHLAQRINDEIGVKAIVPERDIVYELG